MRKNEGGISTSGEYFFPSWEKKSCNLANLAGGLTPTHAHIYVREANGVHIPKDSSLEPVFSPTGFQQLTLVGHPFQ